MAFYLDPAAINRGTTMYEHAISSNRQEEIDKRERIRFEDEQMRNRALDGAMQKASKLYGGPLEADDGKEVSFLQQFNTPNGIGFSSQSKTAPADGQGGGSAPAQSPVQANPVEDAQSNPATNNILTPPSEPQQGAAGVIEAPEAPKQHPAIGPIQKRYERERARLQILAEAAAAKRDVVAMDGLGAKMEALNSDFSYAKMVGVTMHTIKNNPQFGTDLAKRLTENNNYGELAADFDQKYGVTTLKIKDTGREVRLAPHQLGVMVAALQDMENGNYERGYKNLTLIDKEVAERIQRGNELQKSVVVNNNDAAAKNEAIRHTRAADGISAAKQNLEQREFEAKRPVYDLAAQEANTKMAISKLPFGHPLRQQLEGSLKPLESSNNRKERLNQEREDAHETRSHYISLTKDGILPKEEVDKKMTELHGAGWMQKMNNGTSTASPASSSGGRPTGKPVNNFSAEDFAETAKKHGVSEDVVRRAAERRLGAVAPVAAQPNPQPIPTPAPTPAPAQSASPAQASLQPSASATYQQERQAAYDEWQRIKSSNSNWFGGQSIRPGSQEAERVAERRYTELVRNPR